MKIINCTVPPGLPRRPGAVKESLLKKLFSALGNYIKHTDKILLLFCLTASGFSVLLLYSLAQAGIRNDLRDVWVQSGAIGLGLCAAVVLSRLDYRLMARLWRLHAPLAYGLVVLTFFIGEQRGTADDKAWLRIPWVNLQFQPTELLKFSFILTFALHLEKVGDRLNDPRQLLLLCLHGAVPVLLIHLQGDDGMALIFALIFACMLFSAGIQWRYLAIAGGLGLLSLPVLWFFILSADQKNRFMAIFQPGSDLLGSEWQQYTGRLSIGSGQLWGFGLLQQEYYYVPEMHNDFIFSFIGQATGFVGCMAVIGLLTAISLKILATANQAADPLGRYICVGVFATFAFQTVINVGMCLSVLPVAGLTLPFFSAGGSSTATLYIGIGLVLGVYIRSRIQTLFG